MLPIDQVINRNKLRRFGHVLVIGEVESTLRVVMKLDMNGKRPRGRPRLRWLDNIDSHLKGKNTSLKEVIGMKCFANIQVWSCLDQLTGVLEKILELLPGVCWAGEQRELFASVDLPASDCNVCCRFISLMCRTLNCHYLSTSVRFHCSLRYSYTRMNRLSSCMRRSRDSCVGSLCIRWYL